MSYRVPYITWKPPILKEKIWKHLTPGPAIYKNTAKTPERTVFEVYEKYHDAKWQRLGIIFP